MNLFVAFVIACPIVTLVLSKLSLSFSFASIKAPFKTSDVIFHSEARFLSSPRDTQSFSARISRSIGIFSATERNSSPCNLPDQNACASWSITAFTSEAAAPLAESHFASESTITSVSCWLPPSCLFTRSKRTKAEAYSSTPTLALFAPSKILSLKVFKESPSATCLSRLSKFVKVFESSTTF